MAAPHETVLLHEAVDALVSSPAGLYVDGTFGRGGHSREILSRLDEKGHLFACDKDEEAEREALKLAAHDKRFTFARDSFAALPELLKARGLGEVDGILLDLGVSSPQLDQAERGFSFQQDGPLDMRMDRSRGESAADWIASASEQEIVDVLRDYGEERYAKRIAGAIVKAREESPLTRTAQLAAIVRDAHPRWEKHKHPATRAFQAIRIRVNRELDDLADLLSLALSVLSVGGRLVVISFHSLEDRLVKRHFRDMSRGPQLPRNLPVRDAESGAQMRLIGKAMRASDSEVSDNPRSRSAIMRCAEKLA
ncbi:16S rRNA (cytosine(1402)-N(4))-methyltransferase RsmH [Congregibacter brevis]|uniref:Ribosomal RNA small subunit methyltransferase H n=1 Tax=Congregibacter brevis TaxID=3081201 RepID=A0ABZ0IGT0_9GAMM|nr:16S rRNA (cytosine(1402)-N(4))-methyltransferase RsmH [Congregibacter sp. IMCC45268]